MTQSNPDGLKNSNYDRASGLLTSLLILVGSTVAILAVVWLTVSYQVRLRYRPVGRWTTPNTGTQQSKQQMGMEEIQDTDRALGRELDKLIDSISSNPALLDPLPGNNKAGSGFGPGSNRKVGPDGGADLTLPASLKVIRYLTASDDEYARQLDFFKIQIAVIDRATYTAKVAGNFMGKLVTSRLGRRQLRQAYVTSFPRNSEFREFDRRLLQRAGMTVGQGKIVVHIMPVEVMRDLGEKEIAQLKNPNQADRIYKTVFGVRGKKAGYECYVIDQIVR